MKKGASRELMRPTGIHVAVMVVGVWDMRAGGFTPSGATRKHQRLTVILKVSTTINVQGHS